MLQVSECVRRREPAEAPPIIALCQRPPGVRRVPGDAHGGEEPQAAQAPLPPEAQALLQDVHLR